MAPLRVLPLGAVCLVLAATAHVVAGSGGGTELYYSEEHVGAGWSTVAFQFDGGRVELSTRATSPQSPAHVRATLYDEHAAFMAGVTNLLHGRLAVIVDTEPVDGVPISYRRVGGGSLDGLTASVGVDDLRPGTYYAVATSAGTLDAWRLEIRATSTVSVLGAESGAESYLVMGTDFGGGDRVAVEGPATIVRAQSGTSVTIPAAATPVLEFYGTSTVPDPVDTSFDELVMTHPDGAAETCPCRSTAIDRANALPAGPYTFSIDGIGAEPAVGDTHVLALADIRVPNALG